MTLATPTLTPEQFRRSFPGGKRSRVRFKPKAGEMNKLETAYAGRLRDLQLAGEILWWKYESITLKLAKATHMRWDFAVVTADGELQLHDCKAGPLEEDWWAKAKIAAAMFPIPMYVARRTGAGWILEEIG